MMRWLFAALLMLASTGACALHKDRHVEIISVTLQSFQLCVATRGETDLLTSGTDFIIDAAVEEDESFTPRFFNWHFYDAYRDTEHAMGTTWYGAKTSLHDIYAQRIDELSQALEAFRAGRTYIAAGRIINYIQDMTVPAHVAPIYHYKFGWFDLSEAFGAMLRWKSQRLIWNEKACNTDALEQLDLAAAMQLLLVDTAERTRERIRAPIPVDSDHPLHGKTWEAFWVLREPGKDYAGAPAGFAPYGEQGEDGFTRLCDSDHAICTAFFRDSYYDAVETSLKVLLLINATLNRKSTTVQ